MKRTKIGKQQFEWNTFYRLTYCSWKGLTLYKTPLSQSHAYVCIHTITLAPRRSKKIPACIVYYILSGVLRLRHPQQRIAVAHIKSSIHTGFICECLTVLGLALLVMRSSPTEWICLFTATAMSSNMDWVLCLYTHTYAPSSMRMKYENSKMFRRVCLLKSILTFRLGVQHKELCETSISTCASKNCSNSDSEPFQDFLANSIDEASFMW